MRLLINFSKSPMGVLMFKSRLILVVPALILTFVLSANSPAAVLTIPTQDAAPFDKIEIPVLASDFSGVAGIQLYISYDVDFLIVDSINTDNLPGATFNLGINDEIIVVWEDFENPITLPDNSALIMMYFSVGEALGSLAIGFADDPIYHVEILDETGEIIPVTLNEGGVNITPTDVTDDNSVFPGKFELKQNYPNPFNPSTTVAYTLNRPDRLIFEVFNITGQQVDRIDFGYKPAGSHTFVYNAGTLASGVYTYRLSGANESQTREMILLK